MIEVTGESQEVNTSVASEKTPYSVVTLEAFDKSFPEHTTDLGYILDGIDRQLVNNYTQQESHIFPGVFFPMSSVFVSPDMLNGLRTNTEKEIDCVKTTATPENFRPKRIDYFLFPAYAVPPDVGIDRVIRELPKVVHALQEGKVPPEITVYFMGSPTALGGQVTEEWIAAVNKNGMDTYGRLYAEYINSLKNTYTVEAASEDDSQKRFTWKEMRHGNDRIVLQGVSKGAIVADRTSNHLDPKLQFITQRLFDNPAGDHRPGETMRGLQSAAGLIGETVGRILTDPVMQGLMKRNPSFGKYIEKKKNIQPDSSEQKKLKMRAQLAESRVLFFGQPLDSEKRSFERQGLQDPLSTNLEDL